MNEGVRESEQWGEMIKLRDANFIARTARLKTSTTLKWSEQAE
jgi:hypothetical protein